MLKISAVYLDKKKIYFWKKMLAKPYGQDSYFLNNKLAQFWSEDFLLNLPRFRFQNIEMVDLFQNLCRLWSFQLGNFMRSYFVLLCQTFVDLTWNMLCNKLQKGSQNSCKIDLVTICAQSAHKFVHIILGHRFFLKLLVKDEENVYTFF